MNQFGDAQSGQPGESVNSLSDIANLMDGDDAPEQEETLEAEGEDEAPEESEVDETDEPAEEADDAEEPTFTIKHDGKDVTLKQSELLKQAQLGFDYTQKTMAVAEQRKAVETERQQAEALRAQHEQALQQQAERLSAFEQFVEAQVGDPPPIEWAREDAAYYLAQKELYEARKGQLHEVREALNRNREEQARQRHAWIAQQAEQTERALRDTLPGWNDEMLTTLAQYGQSLGLNPQTMDIAFVQKGLWEALHKARAYDELQARKAQLKPKAELPKVTAPKASTQPPRGIVAKQAAEAAYRKKPSLDTLANLL